MRNYFAGFMLVFALVAAPGFAQDLGIFDANQDIGEVDAAGMVQMDGDTWQVIGSGADIWSTADEFHFLYAEVEGDFSFSVDNPYIGAYGDPASTNDWQKIGLMARQTLEAGSAYAIAMLRSSDQSFMLQWRDAADTEAAWDGDATMVTADVWNPLVDTTPSGNPSLDDYTPGGTIILRREGDTFSSIYVIDGVETVNYTHDLALTDPIYLGIAVTSHEDGSFSQGRFDNPMIQQGGGSSNVGNFSLYQ